MGPVKVSMLSNPKNKQKGITGHFTNDSRLPHTGETQALHRTRLRLKPGHIGYLA